MSEIVVTAAFPFVPADVGMAHVASTYLPADLYNRYLRVLDNRSTFVSGIDVHSIQVSRDGKTRAGADALCALHESNYRRDLGALNISFDAFERTDHPVHVSTVNAVMVELWHRGLIVKRSKTVLRCNGCGAVPPQRMTRVAPKASATGKPSFSNRADSEPRCPFCTSQEFSPFESEHWFLRLEPARQRLTELIDIVAQPDMREWLRQVIAEPIPDWNVSRDNAIGLPIPFDAGKSLYLWFESLIGYVSMASLITPIAGPFVHFFGKNIQYYHSVVWPVLLERGLNRDASQIRCTARGFLNLTASDSCLISISDALDRFPADYLRFYLATRVPDGQSDFILRVDELRTTCNALLCRGIGDLVHRLLPPLIRSGSSARRLESTDPIVIHFFSEVVPRIKEHLDKCETRLVALEGVRYVQYLHSEIASRQLYVAAGPELVGLLIFCLASALTIMGPIVPELVQRCNPFSGWQAKSISHIAEALNASINPDVPRWVPL